MTERTVSMILAFLNTKKIKLFSNIQVANRYGHIPYTGIYFCYSGIDTEIRVYNDKFIKLRVKDEPWAICSDISSVRDEVCKIDYLNYGR